MRPASLSSVIGILLLVCGPACAPAHHSDAPRAAAASAFTRRYSKSRFAIWRVRARPAGADCAVLFIETGVLMDNAMIETVQYGAGSTEVFDGGAERFSREQAFRGVVYRDSGDQTWSFGKVKLSEAETLKPCH
jgi:hypothetical protein